MLRSFMDPEWKANQLVVHKELLHDILITQSSQMFLNINF